MNESDLAWKIQARKNLLKTRVFNVEELTSTSPENEEEKFIVLDAADWCIVIPEIDGDFIMVKQWRHGENNLSIEFPGGVIDKGESPEKAAARELLEETGYKAQELICLGKANPNPALNSNHVHFFLARGLVQTGSQDLDDDEYVEFMRTPKSEVFRTIGDENHPHSLMMSALLKYLVHENMIK